MKKLLVILVLSPIMAFCQTGTGLKAGYSYQTNTTEASGLSSSCAYAVNLALKTAINLAWASNQSPVSGIRGNNWQLTLTGFIKVPKVDEYTFYVTSDDGSRLTISEAIITNDYGEHSARTSQGKILMGVEKCPINLSYYNAGLEGSLKLEYSTATAPKQLVPVEWLFPQ